jgi:electron transfer flavoprotein beta subunit
LKILVFLKAVPDIKVPLGFDSQTGRLKADWNVAMLNPADRSAIHAALLVKRGVPDTHITLVHIGPTSGERWVREGLAAGCDQGMRVWDEGLDETLTAGKAAILARVAEILNFDLILTGSKSQDTGNEQMAKLLAWRLRAPCISSAVSIEMSGQEKCVVTRRLAEGFHERVESSFPFIAAMEPGEDSEGYASLPTLFDAGEVEVERFDLARIGIPRQLIGQLNARLAFGPLRPPRSRTKFTPAPDSSLPAFDRIRKLVEGTVKRREGKIVAGEEDEVVEELFRTFLAEGWLNHLRKTV